MHKAKSGKNDEFYTQLSDIENEVKHYKSQFKGKVVYCNCDDPEWSNFWKYFKLNFAYLGLKKLVSTHYTGTHNPGEASYKLEYDGKRVKTTSLEGDGDFRSLECVALLEESDIVVSNPPFSLFREYVAQLAESGKKFLIVGSMNALTYKEVFSLIKANKMWVGHDNGGTKWFRVPDRYEIATESRIKVVDGVKYFSLGSVYWFTNMDLKKRHEDLILYRTYNETDYPKYDNYDAINVNKVSEIPADYKGAMGVPITFLDKYNPGQFEILGFMASTTVDDLNFGYPYVSGVKLYARIVIRRKNTAKK